MGVHVGQTIRYREVYIHSMVVVSTGQKNRTKLVVRCPMFSLFGGV